MAHARGVPVIVDNTFAPLLAQPIKHGADIVIHSATKWIGGHGTAIGGVVVDGGTFDWAASERFKEDFVDPDPSLPRDQLHGRVRQPGVHPEAARPGAPRRRRRAQPVQRVPVPPGPRDPAAADHAPQRERPGGRALAGDASGGHLGRYPGLESHPSHKLATRYLTGGFGGIVTFGVKGGVEAGRRLIDNVQIFSLLANVGDAKSLIIHPASTTHSQLEPEEQVSTGVTPDLIRLSVGLEHVDDLIADLAQALEAATAEAPPRRRPRRRGAGDRCGGGRRGCGARPATARLRDRAGSRRCDSGRSSSTAVASCPS